jgi:hypothetical protein
MVYRRVFYLSLCRLLSDYFTVGLITGKYTSTYFLRIEREDFISPGRLFHSGTILLKNKFRKEDVLQLFGRYESVELRRV